MKLRILTIGAYLVMWVLCLCEINYLIDFPQQHQLHAADIVSDGGKSIRDLEKNGHGQDFRWLRDTVTLTIAQPTPMGILTFHYWIAPQREATSVQINTTSFALPPTEALKQRRIAVLVFHPNAIPQTTIALQFVAQPKTPIGSSQYLGEYWVVMDAVCGVATTDRTAPLGEYHSDKYLGNDD